MQYDYQAMLEWATDKQKKFVGLMLADTGTKAAACEAMGLSPKQGRALLESLRKKAARHGYAPERDLTHPVALGFSVAKTSTQYNAKGEVTQQWVKADRDKEAKAQALLEVMSSLAEPMKGKSANPPGPKTALKDLLCVYLMGDPHFGMLSAANVTGTDFNLDIAKSNLIEASDKLVDLAPAAEEALIVNLGDFFHADNPSNMTARSGHHLDVDGFWPDIMKAGLAAMRRVIDRAAEKHKKVTVICEIGNHDDLSAVMLAMCLDAYYDNNPRVVIDTSTDTFHWYRFGKNLIGTTHGNNTKANDLPSIMAHDKQKDWGETRPDGRVWYTGHVHHDTLKEYRGCTVETFRTLAGRDAWHHSKGYRSGRDMKCDVLHREHGRINRHIVGVTQLTTPLKKV